MWKNNEDRLGRGEGLSFGVRAHPGTVPGNGTKGQIGGKATNRQVTARMLSEWPTIRDLSWIGGGLVASVSLYKACRIREL